MANRITSAGLRAAARDLGTDVATVKTVLDVESSGSGFLPSGKPKMLFEGHYFHKYTGGRYDHSHPTISYPKWTKRFYLGGEREWRRFNEAFALDPEAAMKSASWGLGQVMGANYRAAGFRTVGDMVSAAKTGENAQLQMMVDYIQSVHLDDELQSKDWAAFARGYNGAGYKRTNYDTRLAQAYRRHLKDPDLPMDQVDDHQQDMIKREADPTDADEQDPTPGAEEPAKTDELPVRVDESGEEHPQPTVVVPPVVPSDNSGRKSFWATIIAGITAAGSWLLANVEQIFGKAKESGIDAQDAIRWTFVLLGVVFALYMLRQLVMGVVRLMGSIAMTRDAMRYHADRNSNNVVVGQPAPPKEV